MRKLLATLAAALTLLLAPAAPLHAQASTGQPYTGPRFPGGPDSLRALLSRASRHAASPVTGRMLVQFELKADGQPTNLTLIRPPAPLNKPLVEATARALDYIEAHMPAWQPALPTPQSSPTKPVPITLLVDFPAPDAPVLPYAYAYADESPVFGTLSDLLRQQRPLDTYVKKLLADPEQVAKLQTTPEGLIRVMQMLVRYPPEALRAREQGIVYAHVEIAENGTIVQREVLGSAGRALDAEVRRVLALLPNATSPARLHGQPMRLSCVVPMTFRVL